MTLSLESEEYKARHLTVHLWIIFVSEQFLSELCSWRPNAMPQG